MVCDDVTTLLDAYVDRELDVVQDLAMAGHLQTCPPCAQQYEARLALQDTVRTRGTYFTSPPALRQRLRHTLRDAAPAPFLRRTRAALANRRTGPNLLALVLQRRENAVRYGPVPIPARPPATRARRFR
jgi:anti-sigma factor RsiW